MKYIRIWILWQNTDPNSLKTLIELIKAIGEKEKRNFLLMFHRRTQL